MLLKIDLEFINLISYIFSSATNKHLPFGGIKIFIVGQLANGGGFGACFCSGFCSEFDDRDSGMLVSRDVE
jgi:hypothetical protein